MFSPQNSDVRNQINTRLFIWSHSGVNFSPHPIAGGAVAVSRLVWLLQVQGKEVWSGAGVQNMTEVRGGSGRAQPRMGQDPLTVGRLAAGATGGQ